ncbi:hypothetical protein [Vibrio crassostreae]|uniref:hypothetical protein n=1 Tax=Vibrio crassostreae TaxID=246167 RepID=UPI001B30468A|nr:hypothetical protein [Vibrio crassostreae]
MNLVTNIVSAVKRLLNTKPKYNHGTLLRHSKGGIHLVTAIPTPMRLIGGEGGRRFYEYMDTEGTIWVREQMEMEDGRFEVVTDEPFDVSIDPNAKTELDTQHSVGETIESYVFGALQMFTVVEVPVINKILEGERSNYYVLKSPASNPVHYLVPREHVEVC